MSTYNVDAIQILYGMTRLNVIHPPPQMTRANVVLL